MNKLKEFAKANDITVDKALSLPDVVQETYRLNYRLKESANVELKKLAEEHLANLRKNPRAVEELSENIQILKALEALGDEAVLNEEQIIVNKLKPRKVRKDREKSMAMKKAWKRNRQKMATALSKFRKSARGKAFYRALGKFNSKMAARESLSVTESIALFKAGNSALTHLAVELEHNPEFQETFNEAAQMLSADLQDLLESIVAGESPDESLVESFMEFHDILSEEDTEEV